MEHLDGLCYRSCLVIVILRCGYWHPVKKRILSSMGLVTDVTWLEHVGVRSQGYDSLSDRIHKTPRGLSIRTYPEPGYRYAVVTDVTELSGKGMKVVQKSKKLSGRV